jgi:diacylglycerol kinase (ATP)
MNDHRTCVILNPAARAASAQDVRAIVGDAPEIWKTERPRHGVELAGRAVAEGFETIIAAGGDGTLNEVVNGLMPAHATEAAPRPRVVCGVLPLGTGNDFARTLDLPRDAKEAWEILERRRTRSVDVVALERERCERWFINVSAGGAIDQIHDSLSDDLKQRWGPFAYLRAGAEVLAKLFTESEPHHVEMRLDGGEPIERDLWSLAIANGRTAGGGIPVAPQADPGDGLLDVIAIASVRGVAMAKVAAQVLLGKHLDDHLPGDRARAAAGATEDDPVFFARARTIEIRSTPSMPFTTDGEIVPGSESFFVVHAGALEMIVGPAPE